MHRQNRAAVVIGAAMICCRAHAEQLRIGARRVGAAAGSSTLSSSVGAPPRGALDAVLAPAQAHQPERVRHRAQREQQRVHTREQRLLFDPVN